VTPKIAGAAVLAGVLLACGSGGGAASAPSSPAPGAPGPGLSLLFIGNSLTETNGLPATVEALGRTAGVALRCVAVTRGGFSLEDHWNDGEARRAIARGGWSHVVLQQGPSALPESRVLLDEYARRFDVEIRRAGARPALFMVWPSADRSGDFEGVSRSYTEAATLVDGLLFPAGDAWRAAWRRDPGLALYGPDGFHPSRLGSALAALVIFNRLTDRIPPAGSLPGISADEFAALVAATRDVAAAAALRH
jgi:hypothetical protein